MNKRSRSERRRRDPEAIDFAREQRARSNEFSRAVWWIVRNQGCRGQKFRREHPIPPYTVDFCCVALKLILEVDGKHHQTQAAQIRDLHRDQFLADQGYEVMRIQGYDVLRDPAGVRNRIVDAIDRRSKLFGPLSPGPSPPAS